MATHEAESSRRQERAVISKNEWLQGEYFELVVQAPAIVPAVQPGQFVHALLPNLGHRVLRRPFSICDVDLANGGLCIVYKVVGEGTRHLATLPAGTTIDLLGPLGVGYSIPAAGRIPILVAGGYGCAATYLLAKRCARPPIVLLGGRSAGDLLLVDRFEGLGCDVRLATDDGSVGHRGFVTDLLESALEGAADPSIAACGPNPMLRTVSRIVAEHGLDAEVSLDHVMCCGVGACFACVVKVKSDSPSGWDYMRTCIHGPVFSASRIYWDDDALS